MKTIILSLLLDSIHAGGLGLICSGFELSTPGSPPQCSVCIVHSIGKKSAFKKIFYWNDFLLNKYVLWIIQSSRGILETHIAA